MRRKNAFKVIICLVISLFNMGGCNMFGDLSDKTGDHVILDDVNNFLNSGKYSVAIEKWNTLSDAAKAKRANKLLLATVYAARGGLDLIKVAQNIAAEKDSKSILLTLMGAFKGATITHYTDTITAQDIVIGFGATAADRTVNENLFMAFLQMAIMGNILASTADHDKDGVLDVGFDSCRTNNDQSAMGGIVDVQANQFLFSIFAMISSFAAAGSTIAGTTKTQMDSICATLTAVPNFENVCTISSPGVVDSYGRQVARTLIGETNLGIGLAVVNHGDATSIDHYELINKGAVACCGGATPPQQCP